MVKNNIGLPHIFHIMYYTALKSVLFIKYKFTLGLFCEIYRAYLLNVGVRSKFISRVVIESNIFTSGEATSGNMIFYDHK